MYLAMQHAALLTDLYQLTMAYGYWRHRMHDHEAVFHLYYRSNPFGHGYAVAAGLAEVMDSLRHFRYSTEDIQYLGSLKSASGKAHFDEGFLNYLQRLTLTCDIHAVPEGTVVHPNTPLMRVSGPLLQVQLLETLLLNHINFATLIATKAARIAQAAQGDTVLEFGLRRAQGPDGGLTASRSAYLGGCHATSNVLAGRMYDIPVAGTHAHSWVMCFDSEREAFEQYAEAMPANCTFLVDTYDTEQGIANAIAVSRSLIDRGYQPLGIRLDSGDLAALSKLARSMLDAADLPDMKIVASDSLDEHRIAQLKAAGAAIDVWGIGTRLATAYDQPALGGVYKLAALRPTPTAEWQYRMKLSENPVKRSIPGILQTYRYYRDGQPIGDLITSAVAPETTETFGTYDKAELLLQPILTKGKPVYNPPTLAATRDYSLAQQQLFVPFASGGYPVQVDEVLRARQNQLTASNS